MPSAISNYNDAETIGWFNVVVSILIYLIISFSLIIKLNSKITKIMIGLIYGGMVIYGMFTKHYAEGTIMLVTLLVLATVP